VIAVYVVNKWQGVVSSTSGGVNLAPIPEPAVGATVTLPLHGTATVDESAPLVPTAT
jgi:hypothetical protein